MTEQKIEKIVLDKFDAAFQEAGINNIQLIGAWQPAQDGDLKAIEEGTKTGMLGVKVYPRTYDTPTIPDGVFNVDISLTIRAEVDNKGVDYLATTELVSNILHAWQKSYAAYATDFNIENEFQPTGFNLESSDVGLDKENCVWQYNQSFKLYGIIN